MKKRITPFETLIEQECYNKCKNNFHSKEFILLCVQNCLKQKQEKMNDVKAW